MSDTTLNYGQVQAFEGFMAGRMQRWQAVAMISSDPMFARECASVELDPKREATHIVYDIWSPALVRKMQRDKLKSNVIPFRVVP